MNLISAVCVRGYDEEWKTNVNCMAKRVNSLLGKNIRRDFSKIKAWSISLCSMIHNS